MTPSAQPAAQRTPRPVLGSRGRRGPAELRLDYRNFRPDRMRESRCSTSCFDGSDGIDLPAFCGRWRRLRPSERAQLRALPCDTRSLARCLSPNRQNQRDATSSGSANTDAAASVVGSRPLIASAYRHHRRGGTTSVSMNLVARANVASGPRCTCSRRSSRFSTPGSTKRERREHHQSCEDGAASSAAAAKSGSRCALTSSPRRKAGSE